MLRGGRSRPSEMKDGTAAAVGRKRLEGISNGANTSAKEAVSAVAGQHAQHRLHGSVP